MNDRIAILRQVVVKLTQMMTNSGVQVTQQGVEAYVRSDADGKPFLVNLPYLPENASDSLIDAIQGFLDHEVAHILFTDFPALKHLNKREHNLTNILEDARIEKAMAKRFKGSAGNLSNTAAFFLENVTTPAYEKAKAEGDKKAMLSALMVPMLRGMSGQYDFQEYMKDKMPDVSDVYDRIKSAQTMVEGSDSTADTIAAAKHIMQLLNESDEKPKGDEGGGDDEKDSDKGDGEGEPKPKKKDKKSEPEKEDKSNGDENEDKGEGEGDKGEDADDKDDGSEDTSDGDSDGKSDSESSGETTESDKEVELSGSAMTEELDKDSANDFSETLSREIAKQSAEASAASQYLVFTEDFDVVEPLHVGREYDPQMFVKLAKKVDSMVAPMQKDLERAIVAKSRSTWEAGQRRGKLHGAAVARLAMGDSRVFRTKQVSQSKDVAVTLLIDASGSMSGTKIHTATQAAFALSSVLDRLKITHEVICFTTKNCEGLDSKRAKEEESKYGVQYSRVEGLYMPIIKGFDERVDSTVRSRFGWLPNSGILANNVDGECVMVAARRLMARKEEGKTMIVLSDGAPHAYTRVRGDVFGCHLKKTIAEVSKKINIVGIGVLSDAVSNFYPKYVVLNDVNDLPKQVIKELRAALSA